MKADAHTDLDVAVLGAGPAGAACALALARAGVQRVGLLQAGRSGAAIGETIPPDTRLLLERLGLWTEFQGEGHEVCLGSCSAWGNATLGFNDFLLNPQGPGWHLDRARFDGFLTGSAAKAGVVLMEGGRLLDLLPLAEGGYALTIAASVGDMRTLRARFVVDATGRSSAFAKRSGAQQIPLDRLTFVYGFFDAAGAVSRSRLTLLEAVEDGWWYAAHVPGGRMAVAIAADPKTVRSQALSQDGRWLRAALSTSHLAPRLDGCRFLAGSLAPRAVASFRLSQASGPFWLAIGDAASVFDPLAAQGLFKALEDGLQAAELIAAALAQGTCLGPQHNDALAIRFDEYQRHRNYFYGLERRWPSAGFWRRRHDRTALKTAA